MSALKPVEILLVEDTETDAELMLYALKSHHLANTIIWVKTGQEALDFIYYRDAYAHASKATHA